MFILYRGHGTYVDNNETLRASVAGVVETINKLISIRPFKNRYQGDIGDVVVGRITEVQQKRWKVDTNAKLDSVLKVSSVNLPGGELVIKINYSIDRRNVLNTKRIQITRKKK